MEDKAKKLLLQRDSKKKEIWDDCKEKSISFEENPLKWWNKNRDKYKILSLIAGHTLSTPASSVPSERIFSKAGNIITAKRSSLNTKLADKRIFLTHDKKYSSQN